MHNKINSEDNLINVSNEIKIISDNYSSSDQRHNDDNSFMLFNEDIGAKVYTYARRINCPYKMRLLCLISTKLIKYAMRPQSATTLVFLQQQTGRNPLLVKQKLY